MGYSGLNQDVSLYMFSVIPIQMNSSPSPICIKDVLLLLRM